MFAQPVLRIRAEGQPIRPFTGLQGLQNLLDSARVLVHTGYDEFSLPSSSVWWVRRAHISAIGLRLQMSTNFDELIRQVSQESHIPSEAVSIVVLAKSTGQSPLKETSVVATRKLEDLAEAWQVISQGDVSRARVMTNVHTGYVLEILLVLSQELEPKPLRPRIRGTILARSRITLKVAESTSGIVPLPLTAQVRQENSLPASTWFFVKKLDSYLHAGSLRDAFEVYVDEELLQYHQQMSGAARRVAEHLFIGPALTEIVMEASQELQLTADYEFDGSNSAVLELIFSKVRESTGKNTSAKEFQQRMCDRPNEMVTLALASQGRAPHPMRKALLAAFREIVGEEPS